MSRELFAQYSEFEDGLRKRFHEHPIYRTFASWSEEQFHCYLLQIGFIAQNFVKWYETAKLGLSSEQAREVIRHILRDEIPQDLPTHQDERQFDLHLIGISPIRALNTRPSTRTQQTIQRLYELVAYPQDDHDLRVMITLRMAGEVLVAEQYRHIVRYMKTRLGINPKQSRFFVPHYVHDLKGKQAEEGGHTDAFDLLLAEMITDERTLSVAKEAASLAYEARSGIHDQFLTKYKARDWGRKMLAVAASIALVVLAGKTVQDATIQRDRINHHRFLLTLTEQARAFYLSCDRDLIGFASSGNPSAARFLSEVGTSRACAEVWIDPAMR